MIQPHTGGVKPLPDFLLSQVLDHEFDNDENQKPITAEPLDWYFSRLWPEQVTE